MEEVQTDVPVLHVAVHAIHIVTIPQLTQEVVVQDLLAVLHVQHSVKIPPIILGDVLALHVVLLAVLYVKILLIIPPVDVRALHVQVSVRVNVPLRVLKLAQIIVLESVVMDVPVIAEVAVRTLVLEVADASVVFRVEVHVAVNALQAVQHNVLILQKAVVEADAPAVVV